MPAAEAMCLRSGICLRCELVSTVPKVDSVLTLALYYMRNHLEAQYMANAFVVSLMEVVLIVVQMLYYVIIARAIVSWFSPNPYNPIVQFLYSITEPMLRPIRRVLQMIFGIRRFDLSPMVAILLLFLIQQFLRRLALATL